MLVFYKKNFWLRKQANKWKKKKEKKYLNQVAKKKGKKMEQI